MTKSQIKAELRRSACSDSHPMFAHLSVEASDATSYFLPARGQHPWDEDCENKRYFFLLVAEAL